MMNNFDQQSDQHPDNQSDQQSYQQPNQQSNHNPTNNPINIPTNNLITFQLTIQSQSDQNTICGGFLIRRSSAIRRFIAGFLTCDNRTIMKSFLKKIDREFSGNFVGVLCKFPINSQAIF